MFFFLRRCNFLFFLLLYRKKYESMSYLLHNVTKVLCVCMALKLFSCPLESEVVCVGLIHKSILICVLLTNTKQCRNWILLFLPDMFLYLDYDKILFSGSIFFTWETLNSAFCTVIISTLIFSPCFLHGQIQDIFVIPSCYDGLGSVWIPEVFITLGWLKSATSATKICKSRGWRE